MASRVLGDPNLVVALYDTQYMWWGGFAVYRFAGPSIVTRIVPQPGEEPMEQSIYSVRALRVDPHQSPFIEVFGCTHMGNGFLYVYALEDDTLRLVLETRAVDFHWGNGNLFRDGVLNVLYGADEIVLSGIVDEDLQDELPADSHACRKVFRWNPGTRKFGEDLGKRVGFAASQD